MPRFNDKHCGGDNIMDQFQYQLKFKKSTPYVKMIKAIETIKKNSAFV